MPSGHDALHSEVEGLSWSPPQGQRTFVSIAAVSDGIWSYLDQITKGANGSRHDAKHKKKNECVWTVQLQWVIQNGLSFSYNCNSSFPDQANYFSFSHFWFWWWAELSFPHHQTLPHSSGVCLGLASGIVLTLHSERVTVVASRHQSCLVEWVVWHCDLVRGGFLRHRLFTPSLGLFSPPRLQRKRIFLPDPNNLCLFIRSKRMSLKYYYCYQKPEWRLQSFAHFLGSVPP